MFKRILSIVLSIVMIVTTLTVTSFSASAAVSASSVENLMKQFEDKMATISPSNVLTNIAPAYDAYVELYDAYDTYKNIDDSTDLSAPYNKLTIAMTQIGVWHRQTVNNKTTCNTDTNWPAENCINTTTNNAVRNASKTHEFFNSDFAAYWEDGLYYYDGTNPYMPVEIRGSIRYGAWSMWLINMTLEDQYENGSLRLAGFDKQNNHWAGNNGGNKFTYSDVTANAKNDIGWGVSNTKTSASHYYVSANSTAHFGNFFTIDGQADFDNATTPTYYKRYIPYVIQTGMESESSYKNNKQDPTTYPRTVLIGTDNDKGFYVINYKALLDAIANTKVYDYIKNAKAYRQGRLSDVCEALDFATSYDLSSYTLSTYKSAYGNIKYAVDGLITNFAAPIPDGAESAGSIEETMKAFEEKLASGKYFNNYLEAYKAYVDCQKAYDASVYGGNTSIDLNKYAYKLYKEMLKMEEFSINIETVQPMFSEGDSPSPINSVNCLWTERNVDPVKGAYGGFDNFWYSAYWLSGVYIYDGVEPKIPVMILIKPNNSIGNYKNVYVWSINLIGDGTLHMADDWHYVINPGSRVFSTAIKSNKTILAANTVNSISELITSGKEAYFANYMTINGETEFANGAYIKEIVPRTFNVKTSLRDVGGTTSVDSDDFLDAKNEDNFIYVINYKPLKNILEKPEFHETYLSNVDNYSEGGMLNLLTILNEAINAANELKTTDFSDTSTIFGVATDIQLATQKFTKYNATKNATQYQTLRDAIDETRATYDAGQDLYDAELWSEFATAYEKGQSYFANVVDKGYPTTKTAMANQAKTIIDAYNALTVSLADFAPIKNAYDGLIQKLDDGTFYAGDVKAIASTLQGLSHLSTALKAEDFKIPSSKQLISQIASEAKIIADSTTALKSNAELSSEAYDAVVDTLKAYKLDPDEYSGINEAFAILDNVDTTENVSVNGIVYPCIKYTQSEYDALIRTALEAVHKQTYALYVNGEKIADYEYGEEVEHNFGSKVDIFYAYVSNSASNVKFNSNRVPTEIGKYFTTDSLVRFIIKGNTYLTTKTATDSVSSHKVTFVNNIKSTTTNVDYVESSITLPKATSIPFYEFVDYSVDGKGSHNAGDTIQVTKDVVITANYKQAENVETYTILVVNEDNEYGEREITAKYNERIELTNDAGDAVVWTSVDIDAHDDWYAEEASSCERIIAYGSTYTFYAHEDMMIVCYNEEGWEYEQNLEIGVIDQVADENGAAVYTSSSDKVLQLATKFSIISSYVLPDDCTFIEAGLLFSKNQKTDLKLEDVNAENGVYRFKSTQQTVGNQYTISVTNPKTNLNYSYMAYMVYKDKDGKNHTCYSNLENSTYEVAQ